MPIQQEVIDAVASESDAEREQRRQEWMDFSSRRGKFQLARDLITGDWESVMLVLRDVLIVRAEAIFWNNTIEYVAYSNHFEVCPENLSAPTYKAIIHTTDGEISRVEWQRWGE